MNVNNYFVRTSKTRCLHTPSEFFEYFNDRPNAMTYRQTTVYVQVKRFGWFVKIIVIIFYCFILWKRLHIVCWHYQSISLSTKQVIESIKILILNWFKMIILNGCLDNEINYHALTHHEFINLFSRIFGHRVSISTKERFTPRGRDT